MPQLRHAETSALIAEAADPLDLVAVAREVGLERVVFDDVGEAFDVAAAIDRLANIASPTNLDENATQVAGLLDASEPDPTPIALDLVRPTAPAPGPEQE